MDACQRQLDVLLRQGFTLLSRGRTAEAGACCRKILALEPELVQGHFLVGLVALEARDRKTAFRAFGSVTKLDPGHAAGWAQLARLFMAEGQVNRADAALAEAIRPDPRDPIVQDLIGTVYSMMGEHGLARDWYRRAVDARPEHIPFLLNLASNLVYHGEIAAAADMHRHIIDLQPDSPQAHWSLAGAQKATDESHIDQIHDLLAAREHHPRLEAFYHYAIGKEYEDLERWGEAFDAFAKGAEARRKTVEYDEAAEIEMFERLERQYTVEWLARNAGGYETGAPVFVLGQPRTGTTLIERIVCAHSDVHAAGELQQFGLAIRRIGDFRDPKRFSAGFFDAAVGVDVARVGRMYMDTTRRVRGTEPHFVDKLPQNYLLLPLILKALPGAKIVHLTRNAADACFASFKQLFADAYLHSYDLGETARHHCRYRRLMERWRERFPGRFFDVGYEATVSDLETNARALIDYLDLPWQDACLRFYEQKQTVSTASAVQVRAPAHTRSVGRWRRYETQLEPMLEILREHGYA